jgi:glycosyltransferase involved in cell wall biosynthesis
MNFLIISPSCPPTYCGVGKFSHKLALALSSNSYNVSMISYENQKLRSVLDSNMVDYPLFFNNLNLQSVWQLIKQIKLIKPDSINVQYNSAEMSKNYFLSFLPLIIRVLFRKVDLSIVIHEFKNFKLLGKLRNTIPAIFSKKVFFSDVANLESMNTFTHNLFKSKFEVIEIGPQVGNNFNNEASDFNKYQLKLKSKSKIVIGFHGLIQPKNDLLKLIKTIKKIIDNYPLLNIELQILGDLKLLIDYGNYTPTVVEYQNEIKKYINDNSMNNCVTFLGDIEPNSNKFYQYAKSFDIFVIPDQDGVTTRRTSFWNVFVQSNAICLLSSNGDIENSLSNFLTYQLDKDDDMYLKLVDIFNPDNNKLDVILKTQDQIRSNYSPVNSNLRLVQYFL